MWDQAAETYALDEEMRERLRKANPEAFANVLRCVGGTSTTHGVSILAKPLSMLAGAISVSQSVTGRAVRPKAELGSWAVAASMRLSRCDCAPLSDVVPLPTLHAGGCWRRPAGACGRRIPTPSIVCVSSTLKWMMSWRAWWWHPPLPPPLHLRPLLPRKPKLPSGPRLLSCRPRLPRWCRLPSRQGCRQVGPGCMGTHACLPISLQAQLRPVGIKQFLSAAPCFCHDAVSIRSASIVACLLFKGVACLKLTARGVSSGPQGVRWRGGRAQGDSLCLAQMLARRRQGSIRNGAECKRKKGRPRRHWRTMLAQHLVRSKHVPSHADMESYACQEKRGGGSADRPTK